MTTNTNHVISPKKGLDDRTPIIAVPGLWNDYRSDQWHIARRFLNGDRRFISARLTGHDGQGPLDNIPLPVYEENVVRTMCELGGRKVILMGHSAGGHTAVRVAWKHPHRVQGVILLAPAPTFTLHVGMLPFQKRFFNKTYLGAMATGKAYKPTEEDTQFILGRESGMKLGFESGTATRQILFRRFTAGPLGLVCPTIVVAASHDQFMPVKIMQQMASYHGSSFCCVNDGADHMFHCHEQSGSEAFKEVKDWVRSIDH